MNTTKIKVASRRESDKKNQHAHQPTLTQSSSLWLLYTLKALLRPYEQADMYSHSINIYFGCEKVDGAQRHAWGIRGGRGDGCEADMRGLLVGLRKGHREEAAKQPTGLM